MKLNEVVAIAPITDCIFTVNGTDFAKQDGYYSHNCLLQTAIKRQFALDPSKVNQVSGYSFYINGQYFDMDNEKLLWHRVQEMAHCKITGKKFKRFRVRVRVDKNGKGIASLA